MIEAEEYEFFLTHINNLAGRRQTVTATYLSVNTVLLGAMAFLFKDGQLLNLASQMAVLALIFSGMVVCILWRKLIVQHSILIDWWYKQLRVLEVSLPESKRWFTKEYEDLYMGKTRTAMVGLTHYEIQLTWLFVSIYSVFGIALIAALLISLIK